MAAILAHRTPATLSTRAQSRGNSVIVVLAFWAYSVVVVAIAGRADAYGLRGALLGLLVAAVIWPFLYFLVGHCRGTPRALRFGPTLALTIFVFTSAASLFMSRDVYLSIGYLGMTLAALLIALQFNSNLDAKRLEAALKIYAVLMAATFAWLIPHNYIPGERLWIKDAGFNPNSLGLVNLSVILAAMAFRNILVRIAVMAVPFVGTILTNSRAAMLGTIVGIVVVIAIRLRAATSGRLLALGGIIALALLGAYFRAEITAVGTDFFRLNDAYRGLDTGATGRSLAWLATWRLFLDHPIVGVGFRAHELWLGAQSSSHNGYLALLAEIGFLGFSSIVYLVAIGARALYKLARAPDTALSYSILFGLVLGYLAIAVFERYLLNVGNPTSLLFMVAITVGCLKKPHRTADRRAQRA